MLPFEIENRLEELRREISVLGAELIDIGVRRGGGRAALVITVDKPGGITLDECAGINHHLGLYLDEFPGEGGFFKSPYYLEINSPGLDRPLREARDFLRAKGQAVRIAFRSESGIGLVRIGKVLDVQDGILKLKLPNDQTPLSVALGAITKARLDIKIGS